MYECMHVYRNKFIKKQLYIFQIILKEKMKNGVKH